MNFLNKKFLLYFLIFIGSFFISLIVSYVFMPINCDSVWLFGFSSNISKGLVIYRDFNVVTTPLYYFVTCLFLKLFGSCIISMEIFNSILVAFIVLLMFSIVKYKVFIVFPLILIFYPNGYNLFSLFWLMLILYLIAKKKDNDFLVAFILGLLFITKQNIGIALLVPYLYYSKNKIKGAIVFCIPFIILSIYLIYNSAFYEFVDYCFLGLFDFGKGNHYFELFVIIELFVLCYLVFKFIKSKFDDKEVVYILMFQLIMYPLSDSYHFFVSFFPVMYYIVKSMNNTLFLRLLFFIIFVFSVYLFDSVSHTVYKEDDILFLKNCGDLPDLMEEFHDYLDGVEYYYFTGYYGYLYKLYYNIPITKYDLWNEGNQGYNGIEKRINEIDEICSNNDCLFIVDGDLGDNKKSQVTKFCNYILDNYQFVEEYNTFYIYSN